jgi:hypothetical protein
MRWITLPAITENRTLLPLTVRAGDGTMVSLWQNTWRTQLNFSLLFKVPEEPKLFHDILLNLCEEDECLQTLIRCGAISRVLEGRAN